MQITLRHLRYFRALAETRHFGRAAQSVGVTQPALSARIAELEAIVGLRLADRHAKGARLTDAGHDLAERAKRILAASSEIEAMSGSYDGALDGELRLGIIPSVAPFILRDLLAGAATADLCLTVRETITDRLLDELEEGALDVAIASAPLGRDGIEAREIGRDAFVLAVPPDYEGDLRAKDRPPLVLLEEGHCLRDQVIASCGVGAAEPARGVASLDTLVELVAGGTCVTFLPEMFLRARPGERSRLGIVPVNPKGSAPPPARRIVLASRTTDPRAAQFEVLAQQMSRWLDLSA